jgi:hypothetical protein
MSAMCGGFRHVMAQYFVAPSCTTDFINTLLAPLLHHPLAAQHGARGGIHLQLEYLTGRWHQLELVHPPSVLMVEVSLDDPTKIAALHFRKNIRYWPDLPILSRQTTRLPAGGVV